MKCAMQALDRIIMQRFADKSSSDGIISHDGNIYLTDYESEFCPGSDWLLIVWLVSDSAISMINEEDRQLSTLVQDKTLLRLQPHCRLDFKLTCGVV